MYLATGSPTNCRGCLWVPTPALVLPQKDSFERMGRLYSAGALPHPRFLVRGLKMVENLWDRCCVVAVLVFVEGCTGEFGETVVALLLY